MSIQNKELLIRKKKNLLKTTLRVPELKKMKK